MYTRREKKPRFTQRDRLFWMTPYRMPSTFSYSLKPGAYSLKPGAYSLKPGAYSLISTMMTGPITVSGRRRPRIVPFSSGLPAMPR